MNCPHCSGESSRVVDSRKVRGLVRRTRLCDHCGQSYRTNEIIEPRPRPNHPTPTIDVLAWRQRLGLSQTQAAKILGVDRGTIIRLERLKRIDRRTVLACLYIEGKQTCAES